MKKIIKGVTWLKILILSINNQVHYIMVSVRDRLAVALRAKSNKIRLEVTDLSPPLVKPMAWPRSAQNLHKKIVVFPGKLGWGGSFWTGTIPNTSAATTGPMLSLTDTTFFLVTN